MANIPSFKKILHWVTSILMLIALGACGGGGGGGGGAALSPALQNALTEFNISLTDIFVDGRGGDGGGGGVGGGAGDGAPIKRATVYAIDRNGIQYTGLTDDNGNFLVTTAGTMTAPIIVKVIDPAGKVLTSIINENITAGVFKRVMVNPLTDKIVSDILDPSVAGTDKTFDGSKVDVSKLNQAIIDLRTSVAAALSSVGVTTTATFNPITDNYVYNGNGVDAIIESISHKRNPVTGVTQLAVKSTAANANTTTGVVSETFITSLTPLATTQVVLNSSLELTYEKLSNFVSEINYCLANANSTVPAVVARCDDDTNRFFFSAGYKQNSMDVDEDFKTLLSESDRSGIKDSIFKNPVILYTGKYPESTATFNDLALVEFTIRQPRTGPLAGNIATPLEYPKYVVFKRDDVQTNSRAGNWIAHGNQRKYDISIEPSFIRFTNRNTASNFNAINGNPDHVYSSIRMFGNPNKFNTSTRLWESADIKAMRVKGPGLPAAGMVITASNVCGANTYLAVHNQTGTISPGAMTTTLAQNDFRLNAIRPDGSALYGQFFPSSVGTAGSSQGQSWAIPPLQDANFSDLKAYSLYTFEIFLNSNPSTTLPNDIEYVRNLAPILPPSAAKNFPLNDVSPSNPLVTPGSDGYVTGGNSFNVNWANNLNSGPVFSVSVYGEQRNPKGSRASLNPSTLRWNFNSNVSNAYSVSNRPTSQNVTIDTSALADCGSGGMPTLGDATAGDYRQVTLRSRVSRARVENRVGWSNVYHTTTVAFPNAVMPAVNSLQNFQVTSTDTISTVPITLTIKLSTFTATITALNGSTSTGVQVGHANVGSIFAIGGVSSSPSVTTNIANTRYAIWDASLGQYSPNSVTTTPAYVSAPGGTTLPISYSFQDGFGNWWSGIINGTNFVGTYYVPFTGSTRGIPGSSYRFQATVVFQ
jgi:hypothetical protein